MITRDDAYAGQIGKAREDFCARYLAEKERTFSRIETDIFAQIESKGESVTCHRGCSVCCVLYVEAGIQESEAVVYHLYRNTDVLAHFLRRYDLWRAHMRRLGDPFARCEEVLHEHRQGKLNVSDQTKLLDALALYHEQNIQCPFLDGGACSIYDARPYACANHYVTTPREWCRAENWCDPSFPHRPRVYMTSVDEIYDRRFYHGQLGKAEIGFFASTVYRILTEGLAYVAELTGLELLSENSR